MFHRRSQKDHYNNNINLSNFNGSNTKNVVSNTNIITANHFKNLTMNKYGITNIKNITDLS